MRSRRSSPAIASASGRGARASGTAATWAGSPSACRGTTPGADRGREPYLPRTAACQVEGDVRAGIARADHQHGMPRYGAASR